MSGPLLLQLDPSLSSLVTARRWIDDALEDKFEHAFRQRVLMACTEWLENLLLHPDPKPTRIKIELTLYPESIGLLIKDNSSGTDCLEASAQKRILPLSEVPPEVTSGRGLPIMIDFSDSVTYRRGPGDNCCEMRLSP